MCPTRFLCPLMCTVTAVAGFVHSAFTFAHESLLGRSNSALRGEVPSGALVSFLHKGLQYLQIETHLDEVGSGGSVWARCCACTVA